MTQMTFDFLSSPQTPVPLLRTAGELAKERGMRLAAAARPESVADGQVAFLSRLLESPNGTATINDSDRDLASPFPDGGKWRGAVISGLARQRIIERVAVELSKRPSRHRGYVCRWRLLDRHKAERELERLRALQKPKENPQAGATAAGNQQTSPTETPFERNDQ